MSCPVAPRYLAVCWEVVVAAEEWLVPRAESRPPTCSTMGLRQLSLCLLSPSSSSSSSAMICRLTSRQRDNLPLLAVSTSLKMVRTFSRGRAGSASSYSCRVVGSRETGWEMIRDQQWADKYK